MRGLVCRLAAVAAGLCAWGGSAAAGDAPPALPLVISPQPVAPPAPGGVVAAPGAAGCASCGAGAHGTGTWKIGEGCANPVTCGNFASERTFLWGSCRQFYNPGNNCGSPLGRFCGSNPIVYGPGGLGNAGVCEYGSYNNR